MRPKIFAGATSILFLTVGAVHLLRILYGWSVNFGGVEIPIWLSWVALGVAAVFVLASVMILVRR